MKRHTSFYEHLTAFSGYLRNQQYNVGIDDVESALLGLNKINLADQTEFVALLRIVFSGNQQEWQNLEMHYRAFVKELDRANNSKIKNVPDREKKKREKRPSSVRSHQIDHIKNWLFNRSSDELNVPFYSSHRSTDFALLSDIHRLDDEEVQIAVKRFVHALLHQKKRRKKNHLTKGEIDLAKLLRRRFYYGDEILKLPHLHRPKNKTKLVLLCDVSRSMQLYSRFLGTFIYYLQSAFDFQATFVFNTMLHPLVHRRHATWRDLSKRLVEVPGLWLGGTKIGASLNQFIEERLAWVDRKTKVLIFSDGWDTGDLDLLHDAMYRLSRMVGKIYWLNPVLKNRRAGKVAGLQVVKPYLDLLAPLYNLETLDALTDHLLQTRSKSMPFGSQFVGTKINEN